MSRALKNKKMVRLLVLLSVVVIGCAIWFIVASSRLHNPAIERSANPGSSEFQIPFEDFEKRVLQTDIILPVGKLIITRLRADYVDGSMRLVIPRIELDTPVGGDTTQEALAKTPGLYKYAQIPNTYNTNVSIAGHRDLPHFEFYYLDTITDGDFIYLIYKNKLFKYAYRSTEVVERTNWDPIRVYYDSRVTLTTCTPLGTARQRMIVVGELIEVEDYTDAYAFE